jgi:anaerobic selenocysteine-containing dehydrogenase
MGVVQASKGNLRPVSDELLSEPAIVCRLAEATLGAAPVPWTELADDYDQIRNLIERTIPGFENYNARVRERGGFYLPNSARIGDFPTASTGKANFTVSVAEPLDLEGHDFIMMTLRSHDQFNTTIYGLDDRYRGVRNERRVVFLNEAECAERGWKEGDLVDLINRSGGRERVARLFIVVPYNIPRGCAATYFPEANVLVPIDRVAHKSNTPTSKFVPMNVVPHRH